MQKGMKINIRKGIVCFYFKCINPSQEFLSIILREYLLELENMRAVMGSDEVIKFFFPY